MKKISIIALVLMMLVCFCACDGASSDGGGKDTYAKVYFNDGTTETLDVDEIPKMINENQYAYNNKYAGSRVEIYTTVTDIESNYGMAGFVPIDFEGGWNCYLKQDDPVILDLKDGTYVCLEGTLTTDSWSVQGATVTILE